MLDTDYKEHEMVDMEVLKVKKRPRVGLEDKMVATEVVK